MSFLKQFFSSKPNPNKKVENPENKKIIDLYIANKPTSYTSKEIVEKIAKDLGKKPGSVRSILSNADVYIKQEKLSWKNNKELLLKVINDRDDGWFSYGDLTDELKNDEEIALKAIANRALDYEKVPDKLKFNREFLIQSIDIVKEINDKDIRYLFSIDVADYFCEDKEILLYAWEASNKNEREPDHFCPVVGACALTRDRGIMLEAIKKNKLAYIHVDSSLRNDNEFLEIVEADNFEDYLDRVHDQLLKEKYGDDEDEIIEIP
jgi:hypothetical protein